LLQTKGFGFLVGGIDRLLDRSAELLRADVAASPQGLVGELGKPALDQVEPGRVRRREVQAVARMLFQPAPDGGGRMDGRVVDDDVDVQLRGDLLIHTVEKAAKFGRALFRIALPNDLACRDVQRGKQVRRAMTAVRGCRSLRLSEDQREQRLPAFERLDLRLFVDAEHHCMVGRLQVEPNDIAHFFDKEIVVAERESSPPMRLEMKGAPNPRDRRLTDSDVSSQLPGAPMRRPGGQGLKGRAHQLLDPLVAQLPMHVGVRTIREPVQPALQETLAPLANPFGLTS
jgi:hypothetical protein